MKLLNGNIVLDVLKIWEYPLPEKEKSKKLDDITSRKGFTKYFYNIKLTAQEYVCNMAVCTAEESEDVWFIANNISESYAIRE